MAILWRLLCIASLSSILLIPSWGVARPIPTEDGHWLFTRGDAGVFIYWNLEVVDDVAVDRHVNITVNLADSATPAAKALCTISASHLDRGYLLQTTSQCEPGTYSAQLFWRLPWSPNGFELKIAHKQVLPSGHLMNFAIVC